jgi:hypothetical protein
MRYKHIRPGLREELHDYRLSTQGRSCSVEYRSAANGGSGGSFSSDNSADGSERRRYPGQRRFSDEAGDGFGERRDRIDQSGGSEYVWGPGRPVAGACCKPEGQDCPATQAVVFARPGADAINIGNGRNDLHAAMSQGVTARSSALSSSASRPFSIAVGVGGQPGMWRSTGTTALTPPTTA